MKVVGPFGLAAVEERQVFVVSFLADVAVIKLPEQHCHSVDLRFVTAIHMTSIENMRIRVFLEKEGDRLGQLILYAQVQSCAPIHVHVVYVSASNNELAAHLEVCLEEVVHEDGEPIRVLLVQVLAPEGQVVHDLVVALRRGEHERCAPLRVLHCHACSVVAEDFEELCVFFPDSQEDGRQVALGHRVVVKLGSLFDEVNSALDMVVEDSQVERSDSVGIGLIQVGARLVELLQNA